MKILNIAEKPSVARSISQVLCSNVKTSRGLHKYCPNIHFTHTHQMVFTSVLGHLFTLDFVGSPRWDEIDPQSLFEAPIHRYVSKDFVKIRDNICAQAQNCDLVIIWTDCDREGENIGREIQSLLRQKVKRARFSGITKNDIEYALNNLTVINENDADAVDTRMELDLRIGSAFTRLQTLAINKQLISFGPCQIPTLGFVVHRYKEIIQFVAEKYWTLKLTTEKFACSNVKVTNSYGTFNDDFYKDDNEIVVGKDAEACGKQYGNYKISCDDWPTENKGYKSHKLASHGNKFNNDEIDRCTRPILSNLPEESDTVIQNVWTWKRRNIFDKNCVVYFYAGLKRSHPRVSKKQQKQVVKLRPLPLRTVELQKICSGYYKLSPHKIMEVAEKLYNKGIISYPRTETDSFDKKFDFQGIIKKLKDDRMFSNYIGSMQFKMPRKGKNNDMAHSPIYPLKAAPTLNGDERKIYEFISRRFLACISEDATAVEMYYECEMEIDLNVCVEGPPTVPLSTHGKGVVNHNGTNVICRGNSSDRDTSSSIPRMPPNETFYLKGIKILSRNYLSVYIYEKWADKPIADYSLNEVLENTLEIAEGQTVPPDYLTESDLINLMDKNGIGTDATIHEHIQKIQTRGYAVKEKNKIVPLNLGIALIDAYEEFELELSYPNLRQKLENNLKEMCSGRLSASKVIEDEILVYKRVYGIISQRIEDFKRIIWQGIDNDTSSGGPDDGRSPRCTFSAKSKNYSCGGVQTCSNTKLNDEGNGNLGSTAKTAVKRRDASRGGVELMRTNLNSAVKDDKLNLGESRLNNETAVRKQDDIEFLKQYSRNKICPVGNSRSVNGNILMPITNINKLNRNSKYNQLHYICSDVSYNLPNKKSKKNTECKENIKIEEENDDPNLLSYEDHTTPKMNNVMEELGSVSCKYTNSRGKFTNDRIYCYCKSEAKQLECKSGNNRGKTFYSCHNWPKTCRFFQWEDEKAEDVKCNCNYDAQILVANTSNNKGRKFYKCKKVFKPCKFFQWVD